jgi:hypothetical protein
MNSINASNNNQEGKWAFIPLKNKIEVPETF